MAFPVQTFEAHRLRCARLDSIVQGVRIPGHCETSRGRCLCILRLHDSNVSEFGRLQVDRDKGIGAASFITKFNLPYAGLFFSPHLKKVSITVCHCHGQIQKVPAMFCQPSPPPSRRYRPRSSIPARGERSYFRRFEQGVSGSGGRGSRIGGELRVGMFPTQRPGSSYPDRAPLLPWRGSTTTTMQLPQEICDLIIDHLREDKQSLRHCSLISRGWVPRSQASLFYFLTLGSKLWQCWFGTFSPSNQRIHSLVKILILYLPTGPSSVDFVSLAEYAPAFKNIEHLQTNGTSSLFAFQQFPYIRWFGHLKNDLKVLGLNGVAVNPRIIAGFPRLEHLFFQCSRMPSADDPNGGCDIPDSDLRNAFRGSLAFDVFSCDTEAGLFTTLADYPLGYDKIRIDTRATRGGTFSADVINRLTSRCSDTLEVFDITLQDERPCKYGPTQPWSHPPHTRSR